jgi:Mce-associated membrane protein
MPLRRQLESGRDDDEAAVVDAASQAQDVTTEVNDEPAESGPAKPRRRWFSLRHRANTAEAHEVSAADDVADPDAVPAARTPVGKAGRTARAREPVEDVAAAVTDEPPSEETEEEPAQVDDSEAPAEEQLLVPHQPASKRLSVAAVAAGVLFVGAAAFAGAALQPYLADRAAVDTKLDVARTAASAITTLWTYTPDNMESLPDRSARLLGGDFATEYRKYIDAIVAPNKQAQVTNTTQVMGTAVESLTPTEATAIVYTNSVATSPVTKNIPSLRYLSYRLTMQRHDAQWLITRMSTVTSLDLTPQL